MEPTLIVMDESIQRMIERIVTNDLGYKPEELNDGLDKVLVEDYYDNPLFLELALLDMNRRTASSIEESSEFHREYGKLWDKHYEESTSRARRLLNI